MTRVAFTGWKPGLRKVALNALLRQRAGMTLGEAKRAVDGILEREVIVVTMPDPASAEELARQAAELGAECHTE
jgi:hypothetical protein